MERPPWLSGSHLSLIGGIFVISLGSATVLGVRSLTHPSSPSITKPLQTQSPLITPADTTPEATSLPISALADTPNLSTTTSQPTPTMSRQPITNASVTPTAATTLASQSPTPSPSDSASASPTPTTSSHDETSVPTPTPTETNSPTSTPTPTQTTTTPTPTPSPTSTCTSNSQPSFTAHITDTSKIQKVVLPPTRGNNGTGDLKPHGYLDTALARVPLYTPANVTLQSGAYYQEGNPGGEYLLIFQVSCQVTFRFDHFTDPVTTIKEVFPSTPQADTRTNAPSKSISFAAGDLLGYTTGTIYGIWDFGVYNSTVRNRYADNPAENWSANHTTAVCPYDYYSASMKSVYLGKAGTLGGNPADGPSFCQ